jgi:hypothetical protein
MNRDAFIDVTIRYLPLLYIEISMIPDVRLLNEKEAPKEYVTEEIFETIRANLSAILADKDDYLEIFQPEASYDDTSVRQSISEDLADVYMDIKNFVFVFEKGHKQTMNDALYFCQVYFCEYWGERLLNALRALHEVRYCFEPDNLTPTN